MWFIFNTFDSNQSAFENMSTNTFITTFQQFQQYFLNTKPTKWNFGRYKQHAKNYCANQRIHLTSSQVYTATWVGFLEEFSHQDAFTISSVQIGMQATMEQQVCAQKLLDVSINQVSLK